jgi:uncharacterized protein (TIGR03085 family)
VATRYAQSERHELAELLALVGPTAPTLCRGWTTRDLAAHLVVRESRPDAALGIVLPPLAGHTEKIRRAVAARPWEELVAAVRNGPPLAMRPVDEPFNTVEYFVHHEDVRRALGDVPIRRVEPGLQEVLWRRLGVAGRLTTRRSPVGLTFEWPGHGTHTARRATSSVTVSGPAEELVLFAFGRQDAAVVELTGDPDAVSRARRAPLGL